MKLVIICFSLLIIFSSINATIVTVDNKTPSIGDFTNLQDAHDNAVAGDTIYVYPSLINYGDIYVTKLLTFIGCGYEHDYIEKGILNTKISFLIFEINSEGSHVSGLDISILIINTSNISIKKNKISSVQINNNCTGIIISQNDIFRTAQCVYIHDDVEVFICNNTIYSYSECLTSGYQSTCTIINNIFRSLGVTIFSVENSFIHNNIIDGGGADLSYNNSIVQYNISNSNQLPDEGTNIRFVEMNTVFVDWENEDYHLLPGSPAIDTGQYGVDMGIYGGAAPYVDNGFPGIPAIYEFHSPHITTQESGLDVEIKAKTTREWLWKK